MNSNMINAFLGSRAHKLFREVVESKFFLRDVPKLSPLHQTYSLEVFHSVVNTFAPKSTHFFYPAMMARQNFFLYVYLYCWESIFSLGLIKNSTVFILIQTIICVAALHFNENSQRHQAVTKDGELQWRLSYPKRNKGEHAVVKSCKTSITYVMYLSLIHI